MPITPPRSDCQRQVLIQEVLNHGERGSNRLITHSTSVVTLMRGLGGSLGHVVGHHIKSGTERGANMTELNMMAKHMHAHVDVSGCGLVCRMKSHGNGPPCCPRRCRWGEDHRTQGARGA